MESNAPYTRKRLRPEDWQDIEPSKVIHIRDLCEHTLEIDISRTLEKFGAIRDIAMIPKKRQALVEFQDINSAKDVIRMYRDDFLYISNKPAKVNFSTSEHVVKRTGPLQEAVSSASKVLVFFIYEAIYPITVDVIIKICKPHGRVVRIFINRKGQVLQALVEFYSVEDAVRVKRNLNGADIYSGCCTLKIEFAITNRVNVGPNSNDSWDAENPIVCPIGKQSNSLLDLPNDPRSVLQRLGLIAHTSMQLAQRNMAAYDQHDYNMDMGSFDEGSMNNNSNDNNTSHGGILGIGGVGGGFPGYNEGIQHQNGNDISTNGHCVAMLYGLNVQRINCDKLFNLLCIYGNILKIKFLKSKEGSAMVQMSDTMSLNRMLSLLHNQTLFGQILQLQVSKQSTIMNVPVPFQLPDGTVSFKDFSGSRENRFTNVQSADKNRVFAPSMTVNYWNAPPHFSFDSIKEEFAKMEAPTPTDFHQLTDRDKSSSGLLQWTSVEDATNAVALCNHIMINAESSKYPYQLKLSFSESAIRHGVQRNNLNNSTSTITTNNNKNNSNVELVGGTSIRRDGLRGARTGPPRRGRV